MKTRTHRFSRPLLRRAFIFSTALCLGFQAVGAGNPLCAGILAAGTTGSITLSPGSAGTLAGRSFDVYQVLLAEKSTDGKSHHYGMNKKHRAALQLTMSAIKGRGPENFDDNDIFAYLETLKAASASSGPNSELRRFTEILYPLLQKESTPDKTVTIQESDLVNGKYTISGLEGGWYLINETNVPATSTAHRGASLCMLDTVTGGNVEMVLKNEIPEMIKKIHEDDHNVGWNDIGDYEIGQNVPYKFEVRIPQISAYTDGYYLNFMDRMDEELLFHQNSIRVTLKDDKKTVTIPASEYQVILTNEDTTFEVRFDDFKAVCDKYFPDTNADGTRPYGQILTVEFEAEISQSAFDVDQGAKPLENKAAMEFSSDPRVNMGGKHSTTPWDTVVCYSYFLKGNKLNPENRPLKGAKFKLYRDAACKDEIKMIPAINGYILFPEDKEQNNPNMAKQVREMETDSSGWLRIYGLDQGDYYLKETQAPTGYNLLDGPIRLTITPQFMTDRDSYQEGFKDINGKVLTGLDARAYITKHTLSGDTTEEQDLNATIDRPTIELDIINQPGSKLPMTGSSTAVLSLSAGGLLVIGGLSMNSRKNRKRKETASEDEMNQA